MTDEYERLKAQKNAILKKQSAPIRDALAGLMAAYERLVRSEFEGTNLADFEAKAPWRCAEYVAAENALKALDVEAEPPPGSSRK